MTMIRMIGAAGLILMACACSGRSATGNSDDEVINIEIVPDNGTNVSDGDPLNLLREK